MKRIEKACTNPNGENRAKNNCWCRDCKRKYGMEYYNKTKRLTGPATCIACGSGSTYYKFCSSECKIQYRTQKQGDCLIWTGSLTNGQPYECLSNPNALTKYYKQGVRRWLYKRDKKQVGMEFVVVNACGNNLCVNPDHSKAVDRIDFYREVQKNSVEKKRL